MRSARSETYLVQRLKKAAAMSASVGNWTSAFAMWTMIHQAEPTIENQVRLLEAARLAGCLPALGWLRTMSCEEVTDVLTPEHAGHLLGEIARSRPLAGSEVDHLREVYGELPRSVLASIRLEDDSLPGPLLDALGLHEVDAASASVWASCDRPVFEVLDPGKEVDVPRLQVLFPSEFPQDDLHFSVRPAAVMGMDNVTAWVASDLMMVAPDRPVVDFYSWEGSELNSPMRDSRILSFDGARLRLISSENPADVELAEAAWLGYPLSSGWGHWVRDILCRLVYLAEVVDLSRVPVIIDSAVPRRFRGFAEMLFPEIRLVALDSGARVSASRLWVSPSRVFATHNPRWHADALQYRLNAEPDSFRRLRGRIDGSQIPLDADLVKLRRVHLSRELALQGRTIHDAIRLDRTLTKAGYVSVDPGSLTNAQQVSLFLGKKSFIGLDGSQWFLAAIGDPGTGSLVIGHDLAVDSRGRSWAIQENTGSRPRWVLGVRDFPMPGYGETIYHQSFSLPPDGWVALEAAIAGS